MRTKTIVVTGGNTGIGKAIASSLASRGYRVIITSRSHEKGKRAIEEIADLTGNRSIEFVVCNLDTVTNTKRLAETLIEKYPDISILINNAGVWMSRRKITEDGLEYTFMVNHLAPLILSMMLFPTLRANAPSRIINVNAALYEYGKIDLEATPYGKDFGRLRTYMNTKLCNIYFTRELSRRIAGSGVTVNAVHPGVIRTSLGETGNIFGRLFYLLKICMPPAEEGAKAPVLLATSGELADKNGKYFYLEKETQYARVALNDRLSENLWELSLRLAGIDRQMLEHIIQPD